MAKNYIDNLAEEAAKGLREKAEQGMWPSFSPLGYRNITLPDGHRGIEPDPERAQLIAKLFDLYATGDYSLKEVARMVRQEGLRYRSSGDVVPTPSVHKMLRNRMYTGEFVWKGRLYRGKYQPLISRDLYERVQNVLDDRGARRPKKGRHKFAFSGLVRCGHCGCSMTGEIHKGRYVYYRCTGYKGRCPEKYAREEAIADQFATALESLRLGDEVTEFIVKALRESHQEEKQFHEEALTRLSAEHAQLQNRPDLRAKLQAYVRYFVDRPHASANQVLWVVPNEQREEQLARLLRDLAQHWFDQWDLERPHHHSVSDQRYLPSGGAGGGADSGLTPPDVRGQAGRQNQRVLLRAQGLRVAGRAGPDRGGNRAAPLGRPELRRYRRPAAQAGQQRPRRVRQSGK
jgi:Recombinase zinc beta ribbon domain/Recombinase